MSDRMQQTNCTEEGDVNMNQLLPLFLFLSVASVALFSFVAVAVWSSERRREREAYYRSETLRKIAETQGAGGSSVIEFLREEEKNATRRRREGQKLGGLVTGAVGIGMTILIWAVNRDEPEPVYLAGLIPLLIGLALLSYVYFLAPKPPDRGDADVSKR
jgi:multisubunit Na+/H+ antiporter MnhB subunit